MTTLDERIAAARKLTGYTPGPWDASGLTVYDTCMDGVASCHTGADARFIAAAPDLHHLALDLAAERERLLAICRDVPGVLNAAFAAGAEECEGGSARQQEKAQAPVDDMRKRIRAALNQETPNDE